MKLWFATDFPSVPHWGIAASCAFSTLSYCSLPCISKPLQGKEQEDWPWKKKKKHRGRMRKRSRILGIVQCGMAEIRNCILACFMCCGIVHNLTQTVSEVAKWDLFRHSPLPLKKGSPKLQSMEKTYIPMRALSSALRLEILPKPICSVSGKVGCLWRLLNSNLRAMKKAKQGAKSTRTSDGAFQPGSAWAFNHLHPEQGQSPSPALVSKAGHGSAEQTVW